MGDKGTFYVMDDNYIEEKYVRAEEERQRREEAERKQRAEEEALALEEAERQRKAAEAERLRRKEESDRIAQLEKARQIREDQDRQRREREAEYQDKLSKIEEEMREIERTKAQFITEKLSLAREQNSEETGLKSEMDQILLEKREILEKEQLQRGKMEDFHNKARRERVALEQKEADAHNRLGELTQQRRGIQTEMLNFLQNRDVPLEQIQVPTPYSAPIPGQNTQPQGFPGYTQDPSPAPQPNYGAPVNQPQPQFGFSGFGQQQIQQQPPAQQPIAQVPSFTSPQPTPQPAPSYPSYPTSQNNSSNQQAGVSIVSNKPKDPLQEQLDLLDGLLRDGVMNREEYEANRKEALAAAGKTEASLGASAKQQEVDKQIAQLDDYLRQGILGQAEYDDAKKRVLTDAGMADGNGQPKQGNDGVPFAQVASTGTLVTVTVPHGKRPGDQIMISYQGRNYNVTIPNGVSVGQAFNASI